MLVYYNDLVSDWVGVSVNFTDEFGSVAGCSESDNVGVFYLVNLSERTIEHDSKTRAGCVTSRRNREITDVLRNDAYAQRVIVTGLSRDTIDDLLQSDTTALYAYSVEGGR